MKSERGEEADIFYGEYMYSSSQVSLSMWVEFSFFLFCFVQQNSEARVSLH